MATAPFHYQPMFEPGADDTEYRLLTKEHVSVQQFDGQDVLKVEPEAMTLLAAQAFHDINFFLRPAHLQQVAAILDDPEASENDRMVALTLLKNADVASAGVLPFCQDTGTAIVHGKKGNGVWSSGDEAALARGVYDAYSENNLRYSQNAPLTMWDEKNTRCNLPAQIELSAVDGDAYKFLFIAKGGGSANKSFLYQETRAILNPEALVEFLTAKMVTLGTAACPPYHLTFVIGGTSAEATMKTVKLHQPSTMTICRPSVTNMVALFEMWTLRHRCWRLPVIAELVLSLAESTSHWMFALFDFLDMAHHCLSESACHAVLTGRPKARSLKTACSSSSLSLSR